jgi:hypothetical protein
VTSPSNDVLPTEILRYGAYVCLNAPMNGIDGLAERLGFENEFDAANGHPTRAIAFLRRIEATSADIVDDALLRATAIVHVAAPDARPVEEFCDEIEHGIAPATILKGVIRPPSYTGAAMHNFAYAYQVQQQPGSESPNAFLVPMSKTAEWWRKNWLERHTYFLPRYDDGGHMVSQGHALAAAAGIPCLHRRTYRSQDVPAPEGLYDFVNYFECTDADVPTFHAVCRALRDPRKNPEWRYVREGPTWHGRRVATWREMFP